MFGWPEEFLISEVTVIRIAIIRVLLNVTIIMYEGRSLSRWTTVSDNLWLFIIL